MNWDAIGAIGELIGAAAVVATLVFLLIELRQNTKAMEESNKLERAAAIDRHTDSIGRWRGRLADNGDLARIWRASISDDELSEVDHVRLSNHWVDFTNTQRSNYERAIVVGEEGLAIQAAKSVAAEMQGSKILNQLWERAKPWNRLASPSFVEAVDREIRIQPGSEFVSGSSPIAE